MPSTRSACRRFSRALQRNNHHRGGSVANREQSYTVSGSATGFPANACSIVMIFFKCASGFFAPLPWFLTATTARLLPSGAELIHVTAGNHANRAGKVAPARISPPKSTADARISVTWESAARSSSHRCHQHDVIHPGGDARIGVKERVHSKHSGLESRARDTGDSGAEATIREVILVPTNDGPANYQDRMLQPVRRAVRVLQSFSGSPPSVRERSRDRGRREGVFPQCQPRLRVSFSGYSATFPVSFFSRFQIRGHGPAAEGPVVHSHIAGLSSPKTKKYSVSISLRMRPSLNV